MFWVVTARSGAVGYRCFGGPLCFHLQGEEVHSGAVGYRRFGGPCCLNLQCEVEAACPYRITARRHIPEDRDLKFHRLEDLKCGFCDFYLKYFSMFLVLNICHLLHRHYGLSSLPLRFQELKLFLPSFVGRQWYLLPHRFMLIQQLRASVLGHSFQMS